MVAMAQGVAGADQDEDRWALSALYTHSDFGSDRNDWQQLDVDLYHRASPRWVLLAGADVRKRVTLTDVVYGAGLGFYPNQAWQLHASITTTPDADFTYGSGYALDAAWRVKPWLSLLLGTRGFEYASGNLREWRPGATLWFNDDASTLTVRYTDGDAFDSVAYDGWSMRADQNFNEGRRLSLTYGHGIDPERDPGAPGVVLTEADYYGAYYRFPLRAAGSGLDLILGAEYEDRHDVYRRVSVSVGLVTRF